MSDGSITFVAAWGGAQFELARPILVRPKWRDELKRAQQELREGLSHALNRPFWIGENANPPTKPTGPEPKLPDDIRTFAEQVARGENPFPLWHWDQGKTVDAIHQWNKAVDGIWNHDLGMADDKPRKARERRKAGYTATLTPDEWLEIRPQMTRYRIERHAFTTNIFAEGVEKLMDFLTRGELPEGASMDRNVPKLRHQVAGNIVWFIQEILGWIESEDIDICSDCGRVIRPHSETADWCPKCSKMRCDSCTTVPYHCECDHPCAKHCTCKEDDE